MFDACERAGLRPVSVFVVQLRHGGLRLREGLIAGGAGEASLLRDAWFAVSFLCTVEQWRGVVLGTERQRTSDAFRCLFLMGLLLFAGRHVSG